jgi:hypothetical protein
MRDDDRTVSRAAVVFALVCAVATAASCDATFRFDVPDGGAADHEARDADARGDDAAGSPDVDAGDGAG